MGLGIAVAAHPVSFGLRALAFLLGRQPVDRGVEPVVGGELAPGLVLAAAVDERVAVARSRVAVSPRVDAVDRVLVRLTGRNPAFGGTVPLFRGTIPSVGVIDETAHPRVSRIGQSVPLIGRPIAFVRDTVAGVGAVVSFVRDPVALVRHAVPLPRMVVAHVHRSVTPRQRHATNC
ncbi:MAG: hypothetical protein JO222_10460 [Frankiales bacterium]|nr:hypothetical protein [Frankiales bacterium]